ncbi:MAPEG family protein [Aestuariibacter sp. AA17]|uniref:MAPEG family protein n=1 Tax=Fluctibacter corallii TaxID=2984329 RepID=A0ABT3A8T6_9ALTE|nr:MAPEG family protein [Aestuariibacter sp. AA17]MCV2885064.1 MAPEG family protein [Aestuariibacter sp. AA17]
MLYVPITSFYASLLAVMFLYLAIQVIVQRKEYGVALGDGGEKHVKQNIRAHANFAEYVPMALLLLLLGELNAINPLILHICGAVLILGRVLHAYGQRHHVAESWQRFVGTLLTYLVIFTLSAMNLWLFYR